jgi:hypothetical protein
LGGVYVFVKPATGWASATQTTQLTVPGPFSEFGYAVAISNDGNMIVASAPQVGTGDAVYVFTPTGGNWDNGGTLLAELTTSDVGTFLGGSVAIASDGRTIVAGGPSAGNTEGAVYVYSEPSGGWTNMTPTAKLTVAVPHQNQELGYSVAIDGNTIAAGARDYDGQSGGPGEIYVFGEPVSGWANETQTAELLASDGAAGDMLGFSVAISGNTIVAGAISHMVGPNQFQGALYVFVEPASGWANAFQNAELTSSNGTEGASLGQSVAVKGSFILGGAPFQESRASEYGEVCAFMKPATGWANGTENYDLSAKSVSLWGELGWSVSLTTAGPVAISGSGFSGKGGVFVFEK